MRVDQQLVGRCFMIFVKNSQLEDFLSVDKLDQKKNEERDEPAE